MKSILCRLLAGNDQRPKNAARHVPDPFLITPTRTPAVFSASPPAFFIAAHQAVLANGSLIMRRAPLLDKPILQQPLLGHPPVPHSFQVGLPIAYGSVLTRRALLPGSSLSHPTRRIVAFAAATPQQRKHTLVAVV